MGQGLKGAERHFVVDMAELPLPGLHSIYPPRTFPRARGDGAG